MKVVKFKMPHLALNTGEIAGFPDELADKFIAEGVADAYVAPPAKPAKAPAQTTVFPEGDVPETDDPAVAAEFICRMTERMRAAEGGNKNDVEIERAIRGDARLSKLVALLDDAAAKAKAADEAKKAAEEAEAKAKAAEDAEKAAGAKAKTEEAKGATAKTSVPGTGAANGKEPAKP